MKSREHVTTNGRAAFYASMWEDLKTAALNCGWALGLHGSLNSDMDIMAMPWIYGCKPESEMINELCKCFTDNEDLQLGLQVTTDKPNNRVVYTLPIWADFYLDINVIQQVSAFGWIDIQKTKPEYDGAYKVFGTVNKGSEDEYECRFTAYWDAELLIFKDKYGDKEASEIKYWFDFNEVGDPLSTNERKGACI